MEEFFFYLSSIWEFIREWNRMIIGEWNGMYLSKGKEWKRMNWNGIK